MHLLSRCPEEEPREECGSNRSAFIFSRLVFDIRVIPSEMALREMPVSSIVSNGLVHLADA